MNRSNDADAGMYRKPRYLYFGEYLIASCASKYVGNTFCFLQCFMIIDLTLKKYLRSETRSPAIVMIYESLKLELNWYLTELLRILLYFNDAVHRCSSFATLLQHV